MKPKCAYPNTQSASYAVDRYVREELDLLRKLTARPWNRFEPLNTEWWLIPSTEWPAYRYGKFFFYTGYNDRVLYCGFYVEKGLDRRVAAAFPSGKKLVMSQDWTWHRVLADMWSGSLDAPTCEVVRRSGYPVLVDIDGGFVDDPASYDPYSPPMDWSFVSFESDGRGLKLISQDLTGDPFADVSSCGSLADLASALSRVPQVEWTWINLRLGLQLEQAQLAPEVESGPDGWRAPQLWERCLAPWLPWVV